MQRLNAIFSFIEHRFTVEDSCFDLNEFARARQAKDEELFEEFNQDVKRLSPEKCSDFLDYQLAVTSFSGEDSTRITDIFGRINSGGKQLSDQDRRQAGVLTNFAELVRELSAELRGDVSRKRLALYDMPQISIETQQSPQGYELKADEIFWCKQGILRTGDLRDGDDEEMLIDICASILHGTPVAGTRAYRDSLYNQEDANAEKIGSLLQEYGRDKIIEEVKLVFSTFKNVIEENSNAQNNFRTVVYPSPTSNAQKSPFFAVFMAFFDLIIKETMAPADSAEIMKCLENLTERISVGQKQVNSEDRINNINLVKGLIRDHFNKEDLPALKHGAGVILDFENAISRSKTETSRYEFKQGFLRLDDTREIDSNILDTILETICGIANAGPDADGYVYIGIADSKKDADRISKLDTMTPIALNHVSVVGIEREATLLKKSVDEYVRLLTDHVKNSELTDPLKTMMATSIDSITYKKLEIIRVRVPAQKQISFVGGDAFMRVGSSTERASGPEIAAITAKF